MSIEFIFGSMRINSLQKDDAIYLLRYMLSKGLRSFHVSYEYETYDYFRSCLFKALELQKINSNDIKYIVKLSSPNFDELIICEEKIVEQINNYKSSSNVKCIENIQWMLRYDLQDEKGRSEILEKHYNVLNIIIPKLKQKNTIKYFSCFPYSFKFAEKIIKLVELDFLIDYCNIIEFERFKLLHNLIKGSNTKMIALKPFDGGNVFKQNITLENLLKFLQNFKSIKSTVASISSLDQFNKIWNFKHDIL